MKKLIGLFALALMAACSSGSSGPVMHNGWAYYYPGYLEYNKVCADKESLSLGCCFDSASRRVWVRPGSGVGFGAPSPSSGGFSQEACILDERPLP